jgi:NADPH-dependent curcumin reductase CurA
MPGMTAYMGLMDIGQPKPETWWRGGRAVGSVVASGEDQGLARGGCGRWPDKCRYVVEELGFDACIDHKSEDFADELAKACPKASISIMKTSAGCFDAVVPLLNPKARIPLCGLIAGYNAMRRRAGRIACRAAAHLADQARADSGLHRV